MTFRPKSESRCDVLYSTYSCNFFCGDIKLFIQESKVLLISFLCLCGYNKNFLFTNSDFFQRRNQPVHLSQSDRSEGPEHHCLDQEFTTWQIVMVPSAQPAAKFYVSLVPTSDQQHYHMETRIVSKIDTNLR